MYIVYTFNADRGFNVVIFCVVEKQYCMSIFANVYFTLWIHGRLQYRPLLDQVTPVFQFPENLKVICALVSGGREIIPTNGSGSSV